MEENFIFTLWVKKFKKRVIKMILVNEKKIKIAKLKKGRITNHPEVVLMVNLLKQINAYRMISRAMGEVFLKKKEKRIIRFVDSMIGIYMTGGKSITDIDILRLDGGIERIFGEDFFYSSSRLEELIFKIKSNYKIIKKFEKIVLKISVILLKKVVEERGIKRLTIDIDVTYFINNGKESRVNYKGEKSMRGMIVSVRETGQIIYGYMDEGNRGANNGLSSSISLVLGELKRAGLFSTKEMKIIVRSDSAGYMLDFIKAVEEYECTWIVKADKDKAVAKLYDDWKRREHLWKEFYVLKKKKKARIYQAMIAAHVMGSNPKKMIAFNMYLYREKINNEPVLKKFEYDVNWSWFAIATNGEDYKVEELLELYQDRGESENIIKEYKWDIGLRKFSSGDLERNNVVFLFALIAQNIIKYLQKMYFCKDFQNLMVASIRYRLQAAVYIAKRGGYLIFRFNSSYKYDLWVRLLKIMR